MALRTASRAVQPSRRITTTVLQPSRSVRTRPRARRPGLEITPRVRRPLLNGIPDWLASFMGPEFAHTVEAPGRRRGGRDRPRPSGWEPRALLLVDWAAYRGSPGRGRTSPSCARPSAPPYDCLYDLAVRPQCCRWRARVPVHGLPLLQPATLTRRRRSGTPALRRSTASRRTATTAHVGLSVWLAPGLPYPGVESPHPYGHWQLTGFSPATPGAPASPGRATLPGASPRAPRRPRPDGFPSLPLDRAIADGRLRIASGRPAVEPTATFAPPATRSAARRRRCSAAEPRRHRRPRPTSPPGSPDRTAAAQLRPHSSNAAAPVHGRALAPGAAGALPASCLAARAAAHGGLASARWQASRAEPAQGYGFSFNCDATCSPHVVRLVVSASRHHGRKCSPTLPGQGDGGPQRHHEASQAWDAAGNAQRLRAGPQETRKKDFSSVPDPPRQRASQPQPVSVWAADLQPDAAGCGRQRPRGGRHRLLVWLWPALKGGLAGLFTRLPGERLLEHPKRRLPAGPGGGGAGIQFQAAARQRPRQRHPRAPPAETVRRGILKARPNGAHTHYFLADRPPPRRSRPRRARAASSPPCAASPACACTTSPSARVEPEHRVVPCAAPAAGRSSARDAWPERASSPARMRPFRPLRIRSPSARIRRPSQERTQWIRRPLLPPYIHKGG